MDASLHHLIKVQFRQQQNGNIMATSQNLPGLSLVYPERQKIIDDLPDAVKLLFKMNYKQEVEVYVLESPTEPAEAREFSLPLAAIRKEILRSQGYVE